MKRAPAIAALAVLVMAFVAVAGTQGASYPANNGGPAPGAAATLGVDLGYKTGCRCSIYVDAGTDYIGHDGLAATGYVVPYYYDPRTLWVESKSDLHCAIAAKLDAGRVLSQACPDIPIAARTGRLLCTGYGIKGYDGGTGADLIADSGIGPLPVVRTDCWGANVSNLNQ